MDPTPEALHHFTPLTRRWFTGTFTTPTPAQTHAWSAIAAGNNTLVIAPTGSGKTLAAFLWAIDQLTHTPTPHNRGTQVLYISPLKALAVDVERNLRTPLTGIARIAERDGKPPPHISVGVRSGDTPAGQRQKLITHPPDILITTPESLFLMLTSAARTTLTNVRTIIIDEIHAIAGTKRGTHLALSLERLDAQLATPSQRIGLSATVRPADEVARFLSSSRPTTIVNPPANKTFTLTVAVPTPDMAAPENNSAWNSIEERIVELITNHNSTIIFTNSRRLCERLTTRINEIHAERTNTEFSTVSNHHVPAGAPAHIMGSGQSLGAHPLLARAHHGSVSPEQRASVEEDLKTGRLKAVVATSSLELGIDMGAVDLVIQVASPPSVAAGLQRIGRAGHHVGDISKAVLFPQHRTDLISCAVSAQRMREGHIETLRVPTNPLDVLAQHTVAACALEPINADEWFDIVRRSAPYATLPRSVFEATLDLLSGKYPSTDFAELQPRIIYNRDTGTLTGRPGAQRLAVTSGGTIPDRGMFAVHLATDTEKPSRVGELDEEMVYESRPGDVIALGATSWRITDITHDRVLVIPAPGLPARLPFWHGDNSSRSAELGKAIGHFTAEITKLNHQEFEKRCQELGFVDYATENLQRLLNEQREATTVVPSDTTLIVERFRDELGDWRILLHSPYGLKVHGPLALAISRRLVERYGIDEKPTASDNGIVMHLPDTNATAPGAELFIFDPEDIEPIVTAEVGGSALFASRFRECAARALLLPRRNPGKRSPLWHQRQRAAQLLDVARQYPDFPIILETIRECLHDVYDLPELIALMARIAQRTIRIVEVETSTPSPWATSLLFGYVGAFIYDGDTPLAERRAAALSLDSTLLAELLGRVDLSELLDPDIIASTTDQLQHVDPQRHARDAEAVADLLRRLGPLTEAEIAERSTGNDVTEWLTHLRITQRAVPVSYAQQHWWVAIEDMGRLRDGVGIAVPVGVPASFTDIVADPLGELLSRYARTRGPFTTAAAAQRFGLGVRVAADVLGRMATDNTLVRGEFITPTNPETVFGGGNEQWCHAEVLRILRRRSLAALRAQIEPVSTNAYAQFLPAWHHVGDSAISGIDGLFNAIEQLAGVPLPASAIEPLIFTPRVQHYQPALLDELLASGDVSWSGAGSLSGADGWIVFHLSHTAPLTLAPPRDIELTDAHRHILDVLGQPGAAHGAYFFRQLLPDETFSVSTESEETFITALWDLIWAGWITGDTFAPVRALLAGGHRSPTRRTSSPAHRHRRTPRLSRYSITHPHTKAVNPLVAGRWAAITQPETDPTVRSHFWAELLMNRYGVLTKGAVLAEGVPGGFATMYTVLSSSEQAGHCQRGYFVESLGGAQFAQSATIDRLRTYGDTAAELTGNQRQYQTIVLAATDPANPYGAALGWPGVDSRQRPGRKPGALVVLVDGALVWFVERGGRSLLSYDADSYSHECAAHALARCVTTGQVPGILVEKIDTVPVLEITATTGGGTVVVDALVAAGFARTPRGLRLR